MKRYTLEIDDDGARTSECVSGRYVDWFDVESRDALLRRAVEACRNVKTWILDTGITMPPGLLPELIAVIAKAGIQDDSAKAAEPQCTCPAVHIGGVDFPIVRDPGCARHGRKERSK